jgi:hypothetical protein
MSLTVKILGRSRLEGGGRDINGVAKNGKVEVWGELAGTYVTTGVPFTATDIGLETIDFLDLQPVTLAAGAGLGLIEPDTSISANLDEPNAVIRCATIDNGGITTEAAQTAYVINFRAFGDSAVPELT